MRKNSLKKMLLFGIVCICVLFFTINKSEAATSKYYIKVNKKTNVATVYLTKTKKPKKAFLVSCGKATPTGTFYTMNKYKWRALVQNSHGQYATRITGRILFHSVWYYKSRNKATMSTVEYNKLGTTASHGCVRLNVEDAKWIYDNCKLKTKVVIFNGSKKSDPLGKPKLKKISTKNKKGWDPTDPDKKNPYNKISYKGVSTGTKNTHVNTSVKVLSGVSAKTKWGRNLTSKIKVTMKKPGDKSYKSTKVKKLKLSKVGTYQIKYSVKDSKTGITKTASTKYIVKDLKAATISGVSENKPVEYMSVLDLKSGVTAKNATGKVLTDKIIISIKKPTKLAFERLDNCTIVFDELGEYIIEYKVINPNNNKTSTKIVKYKCIDTKNPIIIGCEDTTIDKNSYFNVRAGIIATSVANENLTDRIVIEVKSPSNSCIVLEEDKFKATENGEYMIKYSVANDYGIRTEITRKVVSVDI